MALVDDYSAEDSYSDKTNWTGLHNADELSSTGYSFNNPMLADSLNAMGNSATYEDYKKKIQIATDAKDADTLFDILKVCIDKIKARSPGNITVTDKDNINGVDVKVTGSEKNSAEGKAIRLILTGGGNWFTGLILPTKLRQAGIGTRKDMKKAGLKQDLTDISERIMYGAQRIQIAGSLVDVANGVGDNMTRAMLLSDLGFTDKSSQLRQMYTPIIQRYKEQPNFINYVRTAAAEQYINIAKKLPVSAVNDKVQDNIAEARASLNSLESKIYRYQIAANGSNGNKAVGKEYRQQQKQGAY